MGSLPPNHTSPGSLLPLKLCKFPAPSGDLAMTIGLPLNNLASVSLANLRVGGAKSTGLGLRPPESKSPVL